MEFLRSLLKEDFENGKYETMVRIGFVTINGEKFMGGEKVYCDFLPSHVLITSVENPDKKAKIHYMNARKRLVGFVEPPSIDDLEEMKQAGQYTTVLGNVADQSGYGKYGEPSWALVLGYK